MFKIDWMPEGASNFAADVDYINNFITVVSIICTILICGAMLVFAWKYRRRSDNDKTAYITHGALAETVWTVVPTIVVTYVFWWGYVIAHDMRTPPVNPLEVRVTGRQWQWSYDYPNGRQSDELVIPVGKPVRLILTSTDVNHSYFIPAMRVKEDVIHNLYTYLWFTPTKLGTFPVYCTEYCGLNHSGMLSTVRVVTQDIYDDFVYKRGPKVTSPEDLGRQLFSAKGCKGCHSLDGTRLVGPSLKGVFGREEEIQGGEKITVDENYIRESLVQPMAKIVKDYPPAMTPFPIVAADPSKPTELTERELDSLIAFLKTVK